jgi:hypothetical protein
LDALVPAEGGDVPLRARLSTLQGLLTLSMVMTESGDEHTILQLATSAVPSIARSRLQAAYLKAGTWLAVAGPCQDPQVQADLQAQFAVLSEAGGALAIAHEP